MRKFRGKVVSDKMNNTVVVQIVRSQVIPIYKKRVRYSKKFLADDRLKAKTGDEVIIQESRPISKRKRWKVVEVL